MKKRILSLAMVLALVAVMAVPMAVLAAEGTVTATVSGKLIAVTVTDGTVAYGILGTSATKNTALYHAANNPQGTTVAETQTITNTGTVAEDFAIKTSIAVKTTGTTDWTLHATTPGADVMTHAYLVTDTQYAAAAPIGTFTKWTTADSYVTGAGGTTVAASSAKYLELQIGMPTSITDYAAHTITVTVLATES